MFQTIKKRHLYKIIMPGLLVLLLNLTVFTQPAYACTPTLVPLTPGPTPTAFTLEAHLNASMFVFEGTITSAVRETGGMYRYIVTVSVDHYFKGNGPQSVDVFGLGEGGDCAPHAGVGEHGIFYTYQDSNDQELYIISSSRLEMAEPGVVATLANLASQTPVPAATPQLTAKPSRNLLFTGLFIFIAIALVIVALIVLVLVRNRKKTG